MAKFYVQSGNLRTVITANNSRGAALWAVHRALSGVLPFVGDGCENPTTGDSHSFKLDDTIRVDQRGFDRGTARRFDSLDLITEWSQLLVALSRLEQELSPQPAQAAA